MKRLLLGALLALLALAGQARAMTCPPYPFTLLNGTVADASQVMANFGSIADCVNALPSGVQEWPGFTESSPLTVFLQAGGIGTGAACTNPGTPCGNLADAVASASLLFAVTNKVTIDAVGNPTMVGGTIKAGLRWVNTFDPTGSSSREPVLELLGPITLTQPTGSVFVLNVTMGATLRLNTVTLQAAASNFNVGLGADWLSHVILDGVTIDSQNFNTPDAIAINAGHFSIVEMGNVTFKNAWLYAVEGEIQGTFYHYGTFACDGTFSTSYYWVLEQSGVHSVSPASYSGCPSGAGTIGIYALGNSSFRRWSSAYEVPGFVYRINTSDLWTNGNNYAPTLGSCANGTLATGSDNYAGTVNFTGNNSSCALVWGKPSTANAYFEAIPACTASSTNLGGMDGGSVVGTTTGITINATSINARRISYSCRPVNGG